MELSSARASADFGRLELNESSAEIGSLLTSDEGGGFSRKPRGETRWGMAALGVWSGVVAERFCKGLACVLTGDVRLSEFGKLV